jgi:hypothetical protein
MIVNIEFRIIILKSADPPDIIMMRYAATHVKNHYDIEKNDFRFQ